jgi:hypothetical protein
MSQTVMVYRILGQDVLYQNAYPIVETESRQSGNYSWR